MQTKEKVVLDCNVIISSGITNGNCREVIRMVLESYKNYISDQIIEEYRNVISRPKFLWCFKELREIIDVIATNSVWRNDIAPCVYSIPDKSDLIYLDLAISVDAKYLITGNTKHFPEKVYGKTNVITPRDFLNCN